MTYTLSNTCAKNLCKRTLLVQLIIKNVLTCFFGTQCTFDVVIRKLIYALWRRPSCRNSSNFVHNLFTTDIFFQSNEVV